MPILLSSIITIALYLISIIFKFQLFIMPTDNSVHFGISTICSIFAGFLYSNYSILLDFSETELACKLRNTNILKKRNKHIIQGIICSIISILTGLLLCINLNSTIISQLGIICTQVPYFMYNTELIFSFTTIILFIQSLFEMRDIVKPKIKSANTLDVNTINEFNKQLANNQNYSKV